MSIPTGWYPDPDGKPAERYWDGENWTEQTRPLVVGTLQPSTPVERKSLKKSYDSAIKWSVIIIVGLMIFSCISSGSNDEKSEGTQSEVVEPTNTTLREFITDSIKLLADQQAICSELENVMNSEIELLSLYSSEVSGINPEPRDAKELLSKISWDLDPTYRVSLGKKIEEDLIWGDLRNNFSSTTLNEDLMSELAEDTVAKCDLVQEWEEARAIANNLDSQLISLNTAAAAVPWYPEGYSEIQGVAFKKSDKRLDCYQCTGIIYEVISQNGCPSRLYVQANFLNSSDVIFDWTNDVIYSLEANQKAFIELYTYKETEASSSVKITQVSCA
jgi:hypothetical protein